LVPEVGHFQSIEAEDEHGRVFDRRHDAEFKLLNDFAQQIPVKSFSGSAILWTNKALCKSCGGAVLQFRNLFPAISLKVIEGCCNPQEAA